MGRQPCAPTRTPLRTFHLLNSSPLHMLGTLPRGSSRRILSQKKRPGGTLTSLHRWRGISGCWVKGAVRACTARPCPLCRAFSVNDI
eukprot:2840788-Pyramimonas_sp.AAC.1